MPTRQTIEMTATDAQGNVRASVDVEFRPLDTPVNEQSPEDPEILYVSKPLRAKTDSVGFLSIQLEEGKYQVIVDGEDRLWIEVTTNTGTVDIGTLEYTP